MLHPDRDSPNVSFASDAASPKSRTGIYGYLRVMMKVGLIAVCVIILAVAVRGVVRFIKGHHKPSVKKAYIKSSEPRAVPVKNSGKKPADKPQPSQISIPDNEQITLMMKVKEPVYVGVKRDGVLLFKRILPKGVVKTLTADEKLNISIAKARSVELVLNGRPIDAFLKGSIRDLEITRKGIKVK